MTTPDEQILKLIDYLIYKKRIRSAAEFGKEIGVIRSTLSKIKSGTNHFTVANIATLCKKYDVNANWIFGSQDNVFNNSKETISI